MFIVHIGRGEEVVESITRQIMARGVTDAALTLIGAVVGLEVDRCAGWLRLAWWGRHGSFLRAAGIGSSRAWCGSEQRGLFRGRVGWCESGKGLQLGQGGPAQPLCAVGEQRL